MKLNEYEKLMAEACDRLVAAQDILGAFVKAYEASDATDFTDEMRDAYARASLALSSPHHSTGDLK